MLPWSNALVTLAGCRTRMLRIAGPKHWKRAIVLRLTGIQVAMTGTYHCTQLFSPLLKIECDVHVDN
jgi:hypothetical protein